jgi:hypothetical protein
MPTNRRQPQFPEAPADPRWRARVGFCIVALFSLTASHCPFHDDDDTVAANPPMQPPSEPPPAASCWDGMTGIDETVGCYESSFEVAVGDPEIYRAVMTYPDEFAFNGFWVVGPDGTPVGTMSLDVTFDGQSEHTVLFRTLSDRSAYADVIEDGVFSPDFEPVFEQSGVSEFLLRLPYGGDGDPDTLAVPVAARVTLRLREEVMTISPTGASSYQVSSTLTSVDPDTDNYDDGIGAAPTVTEVTAQVTIVEPSQP